MMVYYLTDKIRIKSDDNNFVPEFYTKRKKQLMGKALIKAKKIAEETGTEIQPIEDEEIEIWVSQGYYSSLAGAIKRIVDIYPTSFVQNTESKEYMSIKKCLTILNTLKKEITVKVLEETGNKEELEREVNPNVESETKKRGRKAKSLLQRKTSEV